MRTWWIAQEDEFKGEAKTVRDLKKDRRRVCNRENNPFSKNFTGAGKFYTLFLFWLAPRLNFSNNNGTNIIITF